ncbi:MAG: dephospho-CoA kinase [Elusimicrobia bacterium]|nr:dephospho-CoA kinase [Elusimicrobiota bacterium]
MPAAQKKLLIGLTGGLASGKTTVAKELKRLRYSVYEADTEAHRLLRMHPTVLRRVKRHFRTTDRAALAQQIFTSPSKRKLLERILHPHILRVLFQKAAASRKKVVFLDVPLLFEAGLQKRVDLSFSVWCRLQQQLAHARQRGLSRREALQRIRAQWPLQLKCKTSDFVLDNSKGLKHLKDQICQLHKTLALMTHTYRK